jgi:hypothetical protein
MYIVCSLGNIGLAQDNDDLDKISCSVATELAYPAGECYFLTPEHIEFGGIANV